MVPEAPSQGSSQHGWRAHPLLPAGIFAAAAFCVVLPLILNGCSCGHDFDFHLLSWMEAASQWQHGILKPVWAFTPAFNAGEPRLLMYPPLSWATGALLGLLLPWPAVPVAFTWLVLFLSGLTMHRLLQRWVSPTAAVLGGCLYMVNPYMLFVAFERSAYGELMAAAWMPLLLATLLRMHVTATRVALVVALLWLSNAPAAVVGSYSLLLLAVVRLLLQKADWRQRARYAAIVIAGVLLGLLADAFYLLPMGRARSFVQLALAVVPMARPDNNFLFAVDRDAFHTHVMVQASWIAVSTCTVAILCGVALLLWRRHTPVEVHTYRTMHARDLALSKTPSFSRTIVLLLVFSVMIFFLLSRWSTPVWHVGPELVFLQFPWRFLTAESAVAITLVVLLIQRCFQGLRDAVVIPAAILVALLAGYFGGGRYFREACADDELVQSQREQFLHEVGTAPTDEYTPTDADNDQLSDHLPPAWIAAEAKDDPGRQPHLPRIDRSQPDDLHFATAAQPTPAQLMVRLRQFPGWHTFRDGVELKPGVREDGLITVPLPPGSPHVVEVVYRTPADQWAGLGVSVATVVLCGVFLQRRRSGIMGPSA